MAQAVLHFNEQLERIGEVAVVVMIGAMLSWDLLLREALWFLPLLFLIIRPVSVHLALLGSSSSRTERRLIAWFGIRGIGSLYYLMYAIEHGSAGTDCFSPRCFDINSGGHAVHFRARCLRNTIDGLLQASRGADTRKLGLAKRQA